MEKVLKKLQKRISDIKNQIDEYEYSLFKIKNKIQDIENITAKEYLQYKQDIETLNKNIEILKISIVIYEDNIDLINDYIFGNQDVND